MTKEELKTKIAKLEKNKMVPEKLKAKQLEKFRAQLAEMESPPASKKAATKKTADKSPKLAGKAKKAKGSKKEKSTYKVDGKDLSEVPCDELRQKWEERKANAAKSEKKTKTKPIFERVVANVATATKQAIENVSAEDIKSDPKKYFAKFDRAEKAGEEFIASLKDLFGEDYDKSEVAAGMKTVIDVIKEKKEKYGK
jgi:hypothetical protein